MCFLFYFFFFKQKTAYEMRISDWSSDVCSSDLKEFISGFRHDAHPMGMLLGSVGALSTFYPDANNIGDYETRMIQTVRLISKKIGRASCRERVCQYV